MASTSASAVPVNDSRSLLDANATPLHINSVTSAPISVSPSSSSVLPASAASVPLVILVIGGPGKVGVPLVQQLIRDETVLVKLLVENEIASKVALGFICREKGKEKVSPLPSNLHIVVGKTTDVDTISNLARDANRVFLLTSGDPVIERPIFQLLAHTNACGGSIQLVVKLSALGVSRDAPVDSFLFQHLESEDILAQMHLPFTILRAGFFSQYYLDDADEIKQGIMQNLIPELIRPKGTYSFVHVDARDVADAAFMLLTSTLDRLVRYRARTFYITGDDSEVLNFDGVTALMMKILGKKVQFKAVEDSEYCACAAERHAKRVSELRAEAEAAAKKKVEAEAKKIACSSTSEPAEPVVGSNENKESKAVASEFVDLPRPQDADFLLQYYQGARMGSMGAAFGDYRLLTGRRPRTLENLLFEFKFDFGV